METNRLAPRPFEGCEQRLGRLCAGDAVAPVEHEERHALDPEPAGELLVLAHVLGVPADRRDRIAVAAGSLAGLEVWVDGTVSVAFTNRT